jgi:hypothetical protein
MAALGAEEVEEAEQANPWVALQQLVLGSDALNHI